MLTSWQKCSGMAFVSAAIAMTPSCGGDPPPLQGGSMGGSAGSSAGAGASGLGGQAGGADAGATGGTSGSGGAGGGNGGAGGSAAGASGGGAGTGGGAAGAAGGAAGTAGSAACSPFIQLTDFGIKATGSDETAGLQDALDYAGAHSICSVVFPANGTIGISKSIEAPGRVELIGNGCTLKLVDHSGMVYGDSLFVVGAHSYVHHLKFDGNMNNQDDTPNGVYLLTDSRFEDNEVFNVSAYMLGTYVGDNIIINHNSVHDTRQYGIATSGEGFPNVTDYSDNITITNNTIYNCGQVGIKIRQTSNSRVEGNILTIPTSAYDDAPAGIRLYSFDGDNHHIAITNNQISAPGDGSIAIASDDAPNEYISITNNQITDANTGIDIHFNDGIVTGNSITYRAVCIDDKGTGNTVTGNTCTKM
jgi:parallel beta-helix repeat protein